MRMIPSLQVIVHKTTSWLSLSITPAWYFIKILNFFISKLVKTLKFQKLRKVYVASSCSSYSNPSIFGGST